MTLSGLSVMIFGRAECKSVMILGVRRQGGGEAGAHSCARALMKCAALLSRSSSRPQSYESAGAREGLGGICGERSG